MLTKENILVALKPNLIIIVTIEKKAERKKRRKRRKTEIDTQVCNSLVFFQKN
jgi:hypothetical protein